MRESVSFSKGFWESFNSRSLSDLPVVTTTEEEEGEDAFWPP